MDETTQIYPRANKSLSHVGEELFGVKILSIDSIGDKGRVYNFLCTCGNTFVSGYFEFKRTKHKSCGCKIKYEARLSHGCGSQNKGTTKEYRAWQGTKNRCYNKNNQDYKDYGGRGIKVCDRWLNSFENFLEDMGESPSKLHSIDRKDVNGNYEPENCRWATPKEQSFNRRNTRTYQFNGKQMLLADIAKELNISIGAARQRILKHSSFSQPITKNKGYLIVNKENGIFYENISLAAKSINISKNILYPMLKGIRTNKTNLTYA